MPDQLQLRGGTTTEHNSFTGAAREVTVDTTKKTVVVHDGSQAGGTPLMKESGATAASSVTLGTGGVERLKLTSSEVVFNETSTDTDFRIEGNGDANLFKVDAGNDRIGIGTASPSTNLHVQSSGDTIVRVTSADGSAAFLDLGDASDPDGGRIHYDSGSNLVFNTASSERMRIDSSGRVSIGTSTPLSGAKLTVASQALAITGQNIAHSANSIRIGEEGSGAAQIRCYGPNTSTNGSLEFKVSRSDGSNNHSMIINSVGNVGIGTSTIADDGDHCKLVISGQAQNAAGILIFQDTSNNEDGMIFADNGSLYIGADRSNASASSNIIFRVDGSNERMRLDSNGNLGIGESASLMSNGKLTVKIDTNKHIGFNGSQGELGSSPSLVAFQDNGSLADLGFRGNELKFATTTSERMRIDSSGRVGIGRTSPNEALEVAGSVYLTSNTSNANEGNALKFQSKTGGFNTSYGAAIHGLRVGDTSSYLRFDTGGQTERMRISGTGDIHIARTDTLNLGANNVIGINLLASGRILASSTNSQSEFGRQGSNGEVIRFACQGTGNVGSIDVNTSSTSYNTSSDYRLKENITAISDGITRLKTLKPSRFNFKIDTDTTVDGFLAHEVTAVPEAVSGTKDEVATEDNELAGVKKGDPIYQKIDQSKLVPLLVAAVQELIGRVETLEAA